MEPNVELNRRVSGRVEARQGRNEFERLVKRFAFTHKNPFYLARMNR